MLSKAQALGVRLRVEGDRVKMRGPAAALAAIKPEIAENKEEIMAILNAAGGALIDPDGGAYLPWGPYLSSADVVRMRAELAEAIEDLADWEDWIPAYRDEILSRAMRGPLSDLLPNLAYFGERVRELNAEAEARFLMRRRSWRAGDELTNRGYPVGGSRSTPVRAGKVRR
ncbi:TubC N-terminal docking domain-related protein [Caballeronia catudaia]|uniref:TubC N-terminal docking domain-related protein n=1 Tax=Caballeronia catudaia TaxID=1777136 RepID=UPI001F31F38D|nr:hypothetical protein [Caballeronia catudaia]